MELGISLTKTLVEANFFVSSSDVVLLLRLSQILSSNISRMCAHTREWEVSAGRLCRHILQVAEPG